MYSAYKLNKQGENIQPWCTPFSIWNQSVVPCSVLTVASWPVYRFLKRQIRWSGIPVSFRIFHSLLWSTQSKALMGKQWKQWQTLFLGAPKSLKMVIAATKLKTLASWKESYDEPRQHIKKQRQYFANKGPSSQGYGFSSSHVWMWELDYKESWAQNWCFWTVRVPWTARRSNQFILKEISPGCSLEGLMLKLKLQYFGHLMQRADSFEKTLMLGKIEGGERDNREWDGWMVSLTQWTWVWVNSGSWW